MNAAASPESDAESQRVDQWLWHARFFKTRTLAAKHCIAGHVRSGGSAITKAHHQVRVGDVLTFAQGRYVRVVKVLALAVRRGPAPEARSLYEDLKPPETSQALPAGGARRPPGSGRPTKRERRRLDRLRGDAD